ISEEILPRDVLDKEIDLVLKTGVEFQGDKMIDNESFAEIQSGYDAVVVAFGIVEQGKENFGLKSTDKGIVADRNSYQTSVENVFAIGNALRSSKLAVRSVGQGKEVAFSIWQYLS